MTCTFHSYFISVPSRSPPERGSNNR